MILKHMHNVGRHLKGYAFSIPDAVEPNMFDAQYRRLEDVTNSTPHVYMPS